MAPWLPLVLWRFWKVKMALVSNRYRIGPIGKPAGNFFPTSRLSCNPNGDILEGAVGVEEERM